MKARFPYVLILAATLASSGTSLAQQGTDLAQGTAALKAAEYDKANTLLGKVTGADEAAAKLALGRVAFETGRYPEALRLAGLAAGNASLKNQAQLLRADTLARTGKVADAMAVVDALTSATGNDGRRARLLAGEYRIRMGKRADAEAPLMKIVEEYNNDKIADTDAEGLAILGRALFLLRSFKESNKMLLKAEAVDKKRVETLLFSAELFMDKYDPGHAEETTKLALTAAPKHADAIALMARIKLEQSLDFDAADTLAKEALDVNPVLPEAFAIKAGIALRDMELSAADGFIQRGLATDPGNLELLSLRAASRFLADDTAGYEAAKREVFAKNAEYSQFYTIVGEYAEWEHRYEDIVVMMKEAVRIDREDAKAWAQLGMMQMRGGDETVGLESLNKAWKLDKMNVRVFNTLNLYEKSIAVNYETVNSPVFRMRYPKAEKAILERYVPRLMGEAWASMKGRYAFVPAMPVQVELYASREHFSVRTAGLPNVGIQGVCFGHVLASMSPQGEVFNWGNVLWHELGHVFAIQLSKNHVPRWFTEGLSEYETIARRPEWSRELDPKLYQALKANSLPPSVDMNRAFTHATNGLDVTVAYYAASQLMVFTVESFGMAKVTEALKLWGQGVRTADVIQRAFGVASTEYDRRFRAWALGRLKRYDGQYMFTEPKGTLEHAKKEVEAAPNDSSKHVNYAFALIRTRKGEEAKKELERAIALDPKNMDARYLAAKVAAATDKMDEVGTHLGAIQAAGGDGYTVRELLAELAEHKKDKAQARLHLEAAHRFDPVQSEAIHGLYEMAVEAKDADAAFEWLKKLAISEQHDRKVWRTLLSQLVERKLWDEAIKAGESAMFIDIESAETHTLYARALFGKGMWDRAAFELDSAILLAPKPKELAAAYALYAKVELERKNPAGARKHRDTALEKDPGNAEAKELKIP
jgi:tetratricopeptide (TPR) repeat protein